MSASNCSSWKNYEVGFSPKTKTFDAYFNAFRPTQPYIAFEKVLEFDIFSIINQGDLSFNWMFPNQKQQPRQIFKYIYISDLLRNFNTDWSQEQSERGVLTFLFKLLKKVTMFLFKKKWFVTVLFFQERPIQRLMETPYLLDRKTK